MIILACDTSTEYGVFVVGDTTGVVLSRLVFPHNRSLSQQFFAKLTSALADAGVTFAQVDTLGVGIGPGSFTGVRVAVTTMRTLAQSTGKRLVGVGTPELYARDSMVTNEESLAVVMPSRKGEVYFQRFHGATPTEPPAVIKYDELAILLTDHPDTVLCGQLAGLPEEFAAFSLRAKTSPAPDALLQAVVERFNGNEFANPLTLKPVYTALPAISQHKHR